MDSLSYLQEKLSHLQQKYPHRSRYCALRMVITSIHALFKCYNRGIKQKTFPIESIQKASFSSDIPIIVFSIKGNLGDVIIACNYIYYFYKYVSDATVALKIHHYSKALLDAFCKDLPGVVETGTKFDDLSGLLKVDLNRFPRVFSGDIDKVSQYSPRLGKLLASWNKFFIHNRKFFDFMPQFDSLSNKYAQILGAKRISQADIGGILDIQEEYRAPILITLSESEVLKSFGIASSRPFITFQRGQGLGDTESVNNKLWPVSFYNRLIQLMRNKYSQYQFIQLGTNRIGYNDDFEGIDINLRGKTNLEELKVVLKHTALHIDCEGGLVHLRHALKGGPSVVLFGPTSPEVYGYKENLNLRSNACPHPCEWVTNDWLSRCARRTDKHICMDSLTPEFVFEQIQQFVKNNKNIIHTN